MNDPSAEHAEGMLPDSKVARWVIWLLCATLGWMGGELLLGIAANAFASFYLALGLAQSRFVAAGLTVLLFLVSVGMAIMMLWTRLAIHFG